MLASLDPLSNSTGSGNWGFNTNKNWIIEPQTTFETLLGKGKLSALAGFSTQENNTSGLLVTGSGYTSDDLIGTITNAPRNYRDRVLANTVMPQYLEGFLIIGKVSISSISMEEETDRAGLVIVNNMAISDR